MQTLIVKLGATGDVVRTTSLLHRLEGNVTWVTAKKNKPLLEGLPNLPVSLRVLAWEERESLAGARYDLTINLEDDIETASILDGVSSKRVFGAHRNNQGRVVYTPDSSAWFDLSLISTYGRERADQLKFQNRHSYQELIFKGLGLQFSGEMYCLPATPTSGLQGDVAIAPEAGPVWPMKKWAYYDWLKQELEQRKLKVHYLPVRQTLLEHLADVRGHRCLISGDSLPMHLAIGSGVPSVAIFNCTSPWEIYDYGILQKLVSPLLGDFFYKRGFDERATTAIERETVLDAVMAALETVGAVYDRPIFHS
jgi:heptosyltransferase-2